LQAVLTRSDCLEEKEMQDCALFYASIAYEMGLYYEVLDCLERHLFT